MQIETLWLLYFVTGAIVGGIVGAFEGATATTPGAGFAGKFEIGANAGNLAALAFMHKYGLGFFLSQILLYVVLFCFELLPGVGRYKKSK